MSETTSGLISPRALAATPVPLEPSTQDCKTITDVLNPELFASHPVRGTEAPVDQTHADTPKIVEGGRNRPSRPISRRRTLKIITHGPHVYLCKNLQWLPYWQRCEWR